MDYFSISQETREQIRGSDLMSIIKGHVTRQKRAEFIRGGKHHDHYRIGQLPNGLLVATRERNEKVGYTRNFDEVVERLEEYCQEAEKFFRYDRFIVPSFCVGARYKESNDWRGLILTEELVIVRDGEIFPIGIFKGQEREIFFDLSYDSDDDNTQGKLTSTRISGIRYFDPKNIIEIS